MLPSSEDVAGEQKGDLQVLGLDDEGAGDVFEVLSSKTARRVLKSVHEEPAPASQIARHLDLPLQNISYHLDNLQDVGLVEVAGTRYSKKGAEMDVYAPVDDPVVVFVGTDNRKSGFLDLLKEFIGAIGMLVLGSIGLYLAQAGGKAGSGDGVEPSIWTILTAPGVEFLLGGLLILGVGTAWWIWHH